MTVDLARIERRVHNEIVANPRAADWIAAVSNREVQALVRAVKAALAQYAAIEHVGDWREVAAEFEAALAPFLEQTP